MTGSAEPSTNNTSLNMDICILQLACRVEPQFYGKAVFAR
jgi:hypothetical protein